ncbi:MAG: hypothetical protein C4542_09825 [Dehalococcoidia bacterium]|nr:MAG: hypothetical protein C4542_09825 [Dehalococcoidia bacterium]
MRLRVIVSENRLAFFIEDGTYEEAAPKIAAVVRDLKADGITFDSISAVEQHKHDDQEVRVDVKR